MTLADVVPMAAPRAPGSDGPDGSDRAAPTGSTALWWGFGLLLGGIGLAFVGLASVVDLAFPVVALLLAVYLVGTGRNLAYVHLVLVLWLLAPGLRRIVDWQTTYHATSPILLAAPAACLAGVFFVAGRRVRLPTMHLAALTVFTVSLGYAVVAGVVVSGLLPALASFSAWGPPFLLGVFVVFLPETPHRLATRLADQSWIYLGVLGGYGVLQWVVAPAWDTAWMSAVSSIAFTFGDPEPFGIRVFSLLNAPYPLGCALVVLLVTQLGRKLTVGRSLALAVGIATLGLSAVRAAWLVLALVLLLLAARGRFPWRAAVVGAVGVIGAAVLAPQTFSETVGQRFGTIASGRSDVSYAARDQFYATVVPRLLGDPTGRGFGSTGAGVRASGSSADATFRDVDSTYIDVLRTFGPIVGALVTIVIVAVIVQYWVRLGGGEGPYAGWSALLLAVPVLAALGDVFGASTGAFVWLFLSFCARRVEEIRPVGDPADDVVDIEGAT